VAAFSRPRGGLFALLLAGVIALLAPAPAIGSSAACASADAATFRHSFDGGAGTATISSVRPLCSGQRQTFTLLSYTTQSATFSYPQFIYDRMQGTIDSIHTIVHLAVTVPACYFQVDLIFGSDTYNEVVNAGSNYGNLKLGAPYGIGARSSGPYGGDADGSTPCVPKPEITYHNACDGTFTAILANDASANVDAVFIVGGRRVNVAPGHSSSAKRHTGTLSIRDNTFTTTIGSWEKPPNCSSASPTPPAGAGSQPAGPQPPGSPPAGASPTSTDSIPFFTADPTDGGGAFPVNTIATSAAASPSTGADTTSTLVIALGVLLIIAGVAILVRVLRTFRHT
jgi:hypothetical protein